MSSQFKITTVQEAVSTNLLMQEWEKQSKSHHYDVLRAVNQSGGIGQSGNYWESEAGKNLTFSLFLESPELASSEIFQLNKIISLAIFDYLLSRGIANVKIKWPNDIYVNDKKISGILTHNSFLGNTWQNAIVGIGLNINQLVFKSDAPNPISMKQISFIDYTLEEELNFILAATAIRIEQFFSGNYSKIDVQYRENLFGYGETRAFKIANGQFKGIIKGVDNYGMLLIEHENKTISAFDVKEIEFLF